MTGWLYRSPNVVMNESSPDPLPDYVLGRTLGSGSTGKVKRATNKTTGQVVAIKIIPKARFTFNLDLERKTRREIALMRLMDHPHLLKLYDVCESPHHIYIVLELAPHGPLFDFIVARERLEPPLAIQYFREIVYGIDYLHTHGFCHRDLKPENLLLDTRDHLKIGDFGFARWMKTDKVGTACGSPHYAAPEVMSGNRYDGRAADIWSCGIILYALLTGTLPFDDPSYRGVVSKVRVGRYKMPSALPPDARDLISRIIVRDVEKRITMKDLKAHPLFRLGLPDGYLVPRPLPILPIVDPIDPGEIDTAVLASLRAVGYATDEELMSELTASGSTRAKLLYQLFRGRNAIESIPWAGNESGIDGPLMMSPEILREDDGFGRTLMQSPDFRSVGHRAEWGSIDLPSIPAEVQQRYSDIGVPIPLLVAGLQRELTAAKFDWFHPSDIEMVAKHEDRRLFVRFLAGYQGSEFDFPQMLTLTVVCMVGDHDAFDEFRAELRGWLEGIIGASVKEGAEEVPAMPALDE
jgi:serine/threonine protein kinase